MIRALERDVEERGARLERKRVARWLRQPVVIANLPPSVQKHITAEVLGQFVESIVRGIADAIEQNKHPKLPEES